MDTYRSNLREIDSLNQRGGRMLSVVDLIEDGTLDAPVAGYLLASVASGASFLCAAGPGGVGKIALIPDPVVSFDDEEIVLKNYEGFTCSYPSQSRRRLPQEVY